MYNKDSRWVMNNIVEAKIEIPMGSHNKYEISEDGKVILDRVLYSASFYPAEYGYIEKTLKVILRY